MMLVVSSWVSAFFNSLFTKTGTFWPSPGLSFRNENFVSFFHQGQPPGGQPGPVLVCNTPQHPPDTHTPLRYACGSSQGGGRIRYLRNLRNFVILAILEICEFLQNLRKFVPAIVLPAIPCSCMLGLMSDIPPEEDALNELVAALDDDAADAPAKKKPKLNYGAKTTPEARGQQVSPQPPK